MDRSLAVAHRSTQRITTTLPEQATDTMVIEMWLHGRPHNTQVAYRADIATLQAFTSKSLQALTLSDLQQFADSLLEQEATSLARHLSAVKSLLTFAHKAGYTTVNVGAALRLPKIQQRLAVNVMTRCHSFLIIL